LEQAGGLDLSWSEDWKGLEVVAGRGAELSLGAELEELSLSWARLGGSWKPVTRREAETR
jgi:hypothetical protein